MKNSDDFFPKDRDVVDGQEIGCNHDDLARAIEVWVHAQNRADVKVGDAALAFNVSPTLICDAVKTRSNPFFWVEQSPMPHAQRAFEVDGF